MHRSVAFAAPALIAFLVAACSSAGPEAEKTAVAAHPDAGAVSKDAAADAHEKDAAVVDAGHADAAAEHDAADSADAEHDAAPKPECEWGGAPGQCLTTTACAALSDHTSETGTCATGEECCIVTPNVLNNPPFPPGYTLMQQSAVTAAMTTWAVMILDDPTDYPMFATTTETFGTQLVLAQVQWHPPDFQNSIVHRGVTLYVPE